MSSTAATIPPTNNLTAQLHHIGLRAVPSNLDHFLERATEERWSAHHVLEELAHAEAEELLRRRLERRQRASGIKRFKFMEGFDWAWPTKIERDVVERALTLDFMREARNVVLVGPNGMGKTTIAMNICHKAMLAGFSVLFRTATTIVEELRRQNPEGRRRKIRAYCNIPLLCVDEVAHLSSDEEAVDVLCEVISSRHERKPVILTTTRAFEEWHEIFPGATCIPTLLDRLLHHADTIVIDGRSYRARESELEAAARKGKG